MNSRSRWSQLDSLRAIAALGVFAFHFAFVYGFLGLRDLPLVGTSLTPYLRVLGDAGVSIFFVLSAFLIYQPFAAARFQSREGPGVFSYGVRRVLRLFPAYWVALVGVALLLGLSGVFGADLPTYLTLSQAYGVDTASGGISQAWTLTVEVAFYAFVPLWAFVLSRMRSDTTSSFLTSELGMLALAFAGSIVWKLIAVQGVGDNESSFVPLLISFPSFFDHFAVGMLLAVLTVALPSYRSWPAPLAQIAARPALGWIAGAVALWGMAQVSSDVEGSRMGYLVHRELEVVMGLAVLTAAIGVLGRDTVSARVLAARPLVWLGVVSYGFYLWHLAVITELADWTGHSLGAIPFLAVALGATALLSAGSWYLVERPAIGLGRRLTRRRAPSLTATVAVPEPVGDLLEAETASG